MALLTIDHANVAYLRLVRALADSRRERDLVADAECLNVLYDFIDVAEEIAAIIAPNETESSFGAPMRDGTFFSLAVPRRAKWPCFHCLSCDHCIVS